MFESIKSHLQMFISSRAKLPSLLLIFMLLMIMVMQHTVDEDDVVDRMDGRIYDNEKQANFDYF